MAAIFLSHSSQDNTAAERLKSWLAEIGFDQVFLDFDKHQGIPLGSEWESRLYYEMDRCQAVILILTKNWLESKWCFAEFAQARALGKTIFVVIETPKGETAIASNLQICDLVADPEDGKARLRLALKEALSVSQAALPFARGRAPYPGMVSFAAEDAAVFFGRDGEINRIFEWVRSERSRQRKALVILGGSGTGKSSLLRAGALPRLERERGASGAASFIVPPPIRPGSAPLHALLAALRSIDATLTLDELAQARTPPSARALVTRLQAARQAFLAVLILAIDQTEEFFGAADRDEAKTFAAILAALAAGDVPARLILTLRADHLEELQTTGGFAEAIELFPIEPMPLDRLGEIIKGPARRADLLIEDTIVDAIRADAQTQDALPLVAFVLRELHDRYGARGRLERVHYDAMRMDGLSPLEAAVQRRANETIAGASAEDLAALRETFIPGLVRVREDGAFARQAARHSRLPAAAAALVERLVTARLLVERSDERDTWIEVAHEALFRVWPLLAGWLDEERDFLIGKSRIERVFDDWTRLPAAERDKGLLGGILLERARGWIARHAGRFSAEETAFIAESARRADEEAAAREAERQKAQAAELALARAETERARDRARVARRLLAGAALAAVIFAGLGFAAWQQRNAAIIARNEAVLARNDALAAQKRAESDFAAAKDAIGSLAFDAVQDMPDLVGVRSETVRNLVNSVEATVEKLVAAEPDDLELQRLHFVLLVEAAEGAATGGQVDKAQAELEKALPIGRDLAARKADAESPRDLAIGLTMLGWAKSLTGDAKGSLDAYSESTALFRTFAETKVYASASVDLINSLANLAAAQIKVGDRMGAGKALEEGVALARSIIAAGLDDDEVYQNLSIALAGLSAWDFDAGHRQAGIAALIESLTLRRKEAQIKKGKAVPQSALASILIDVVAWKGDAGDFKAALAASEESLGLTRDLARDQSNAAAQLNVMRSLLAVGKTKLALGDSAGAKDAYDEVLDITLDLSTHDSSNLSAQRNLAVALSENAKAMKDRDMTRDFAESAAIRRRLALDINNISAQFDLVAGLDDLGGAKLRTNDIAGAAQDFDEALTLARKIAVDMGSRQQQYTLAQALAKSAETKARLGDSATALARYNEALAIFRQRALDKDSAASQADLAELLMKMAAVAPESQPLYAESLDLLTALQKDDRLTAEQRGWIDELHAKLGKAAEDKG